MHPSIEHFVPLFEYAHLPQELQAVSKPFCTLATHIMETLPANQETTVALRKLVESKDCAVRALVIEKHRKKIESCKTGKS